MAEIGITEGLAGLDEGLRVRHIAAFPVVSRPNGTDLKDILLDPDLLDFDQIPISDAGSIIGILDRADPTQVRRIDDSVLVSADDLLSHFVYTVHEQQYSLVVGGTSITGIVTWSDLLKLPVFVLAFSLVAKLELSMNRQIKVLYGRRSDAWLDDLETNERTKIKGRLNKLKKQNLTLPPIELADLVHKAKVLRKILSVDRDFDADLNNIVDLRNDVAHVKRMVRSSASLKNFVKSLATAETWLRRLAHAKEVAAAASASV